MRSKRAGARESSPLHPAPTGSLYNHRCTRCPLHVDAHTVCVPARTLGDPHVLVVGEAPGRAEDRHGKPFIGPAGNVLDRALDAARLTDVAITNVVKCRPPNNRDPFSDEIDACYSYLSSEIFTVDPMGILALGRVAATVLTRRKDPMSSLRGGYYVRKLAGVHRRVYVTYHPAYVLYNGGVGSREWETFAHDVQEFANYARWKHGKN